VGRKNNLSGSSAEIKKKMYGGLGVRSLKGSGRVVEKGERGWCMGSCGIQSVVEVKLRRLLRSVRVVGKGKRE